MDFVESQSQGSDATVSQSTGSASGRFAGRARGWCLTINVAEHYQADDFSNACSSLFDSLSLGYLIIGAETAPTTGQRHYQGYVYKGSKISGSRLISLVQTLFKKSPHLEQARGSAASNRTYCAKDDDFIELGQLPEQGARSDLAALAERIIAGDTMIDVAQSNPAEYIRYHGGIKAFHLLTHSKPRDSAVDPTVYWWFGPTGVGKSRKAYETFGTTAYMKMNDRWWDGYIGQCQVILDDYRPSLCPFNELLRILDRYPYRVPIKGSSIELSATVFVITTCSRPEVLWHSRTQESLNQLLRRITHIVEFTTTGEETVLKSQEVPYVPIPMEELKLMFPKFDPEKIIF